MSDRAARSEKSRWRPLLARLALVLGVLLALLPLLPEIPREQTLLFRFDGTGVERLEVSWTRTGEKEALGGVSYSFPVQATRDVRHRVRLPDGEYVLSIEAETRAAGRGAAENTPQTSYVRRVNLAGGETVIPLSLTPTPMARRVLAP